MVEQHAGRHAVITGSSTHSERIERFWRDVYRYVGVVFANTFHALEADDHLDCLNEVDLYCLHFIFLPGSIQFLLNLLKPVTIILCLAHIILLLTSYLFFGQSNRIIMPQQPQITPIAHASGHPAASKPCEGAKKQISTA